MDQWYLDYGEQKWRADAEQCVSCYSRGLKRIARYPELRTSVYGRETYSRYQI
jgi:hypothetical protein